MAIRVYNNISTRPHALNFCVNCIPVNQTRELLGFPHVVCFSFPSKKEGSIPSRFYVFFEFICRSTVVETVETWKCFRVGNQWKISCLRLKYAMLYFNACLSWTNALIKRQYVLMLLSRLHGYVVRQVFIYNYIFLCSINEVRLWYYCCMISMVQWLKK